MAVALLNGGADINFASPPDVRKGWLGFTPLMYAATGGAVQVETRHTRVSSSQELCSLFRYRMYWYCRYILFLTAVSAWCQDFDA